MMDDQGVMEAGEAAETVADATAVAAAGAGY